MGKELQPSSKIQGSGRAQEYVQADTLSSSGHNKYDPPRWKVGLYFFCPNLSLPGLCFECHVTQNLMWDLLMQKGSNSDSCHALQLSSEARKKKN